MLFVPAETSSMNIYQAEKFTSLYICTGIPITVQCYFTVCGLVLVPSWNEIEYKQTSMQINTCNSNLHNALWLKKLFLIDDLSGYIAASFCR